MGVSKRIHKAVYNRPSIQTFQDLPVDQSVDIFGIRVNAIAFDYSHTRGISYVSTAYKDMGQQRTW